MARVNAAKAKEKKQKIMLAVGAVLLLGLLAIQGPKFMKLMSGPSSSASATSTTTTSTTSPAPAPGATAAVVSATVSASPDKLASLTLFKAKDPFVQLVPDGTSTVSAPAPAPPPPPAPKPAPAPKPNPASKAIFGIVGSPTASTKGALPTARILFNGTPLSVALGHAFPASKPVFRLAGLQSTGALVALVGGALANGSSMLALPKGHPVTLMNTVDHHRYTLKLLATKGA